MIRLSPWQRQSWVVPALLAPFLIVITVVILRQFDQLWRYDTGWAWGNWASQVQGVGPLLGGLAAWQIADIRRQGRADWLGTTSGGWRFTAMTLLPTVLIGLVVLAVSALYVRLVADLASPLASKWFFASASSAVGFLLASTAIGALVGRITDAPYAPGLVAIGLALPNGFGTGLPVLNRWLTTDSVSVPLEGSLPELSFGLRQLAFSALVLAIVLAAISPRRFRTWPVPVRIGLPAAAVALVAMSAIAGWFRWEPLPLDEQAQARECADRSVGDSVVTVCVMPEKQRLLDATADQVVVAVDTLSSVGVELPNRWAEATTYEYSQIVGENPAVGQTLGLFNVNVYADAPVDPISLMPSAVNCSNFSGETDVFVADNVTRAWFLSTTTGQPINQVLAPDGVEAYERLSPEELSNFARQSIEAALSCDLRSVPTLG